MFKIYIKRQTITPLKAAIMVLEKGELGRVWENTHPDIKDTNYPSPSTCLGPSPALSTLSVSPVKHRGASATALPLCFP